jgi:hypothetical protein
VTDTAADAEFDTAGTLFIKSSSASSSCSVSLVVRTKFEFKTPLEPDMALTRVVQQILSKRTGSEFEPLIGAACCQDGNTCSPTVTPQVPAVEPVSIKLLQSMIDEIERRLPALKSGDIAKHNV